MVSSTVVAPTVTTVRSLAGDDVLASALSLPAATHSVMPCATSAAAARLTAVLVPPPSDMLATLLFSAFAAAASCAAHCIPAITDEFVPDPSSPSTFTPKMDTFLATP